MSVPVTNQSHWPQFCCMGRIAMVRKDITPIGMVATGADRPMLARVPVVRVAACVHAANACRLSACFRCCLWSRLGAGIQLANRTRSPDSGASSCQHHVAAGNRAGPAGEGGPRRPPRLAQCLTAPTTKPSLARKESSGCAISKLGIYKLTLAKPGFKTLAIERLELTKRELSTLELQMQALTVLAPENKGPSGLPGTPRTPARPLQPRLIRA